MKKRLLSWTLVWKDYPWWKLGLGVLAALLIIIAAGTMMLGGDLGTEICGWLLDAAGFVEQAAVQSASAINMLHILYLWVPMILNIVVTLLLSRLTVEKANAELVSR